MTNKRKIEIIFFLSGISVFLFLFIKGCLFPTIKGLSESNLTKEEIKTQQNKAYSEYISLFTPEAKKKLILIDSYISKSKHPYLSFTYNTSYMLMEYKMNISKDVKIPLKKIVRFEKKSADLSTDVVYKGYEETDWMKFSYSSQYDSIVKGIYGTYDDSLLSKTILGDSIINYNFSLTNLSFRYELNGPRDMVLVKQTSSFFEKSPLNLNMNVLFYKKDSSVFLVIIYPRGNGFKIDNSLLNDLFGRKIL